MAKTLELMVANCKFSGGDEFVVPKAPGSVTLVVSLR